eukprot:PITA_04219
MALSKVDNLPMLRKTKEADTKKLDEKEDETMIEVEESMDPIYPPPQEPSSSSKSPSWLRGTLDDAEEQIAPRGTFRESKKPTRPQDKIVVTSKWLYKIKHGADGSVEKYKARFVAHGFSQKEDGCQDRVLHGSIKEEVYVEQPEGFEIHNRESHVCRLKKALYALKQAPRAWYERIDSYLMKLGFTRSEADLNHYFKVEDDKPLILVLYVDDLFLTGADPLIHKCKRELASEYEMKDLGLMHYFLGLEVWQKLGDIFLSQQKYVVKILERFGEVNCKPVTSPMELDFKKLSGSVVEPALGNATEYRQLIGALMFLVNSRSDTCFAVSTLSQHMVEPHHSHWIGAKNLLRYLQGTITHGLRYTVRDVRLHGYTDANWAGSVVD